MATKEKRPMIMIDDQDVIIIDQSAVRHGVSRNISWCDNFSSEVSWHGSIDAIGFETTRKWWPRCYQRNVWSKGVSMYYRVDMSARYIHQEGPIYVSMGEKNSQAMDQVPWNRREKAKGSL